MCSKSVRAQQESSLKQPKNRSVNRRNFVKSFLAVGASASAAGFNPAPLHGEGQVADVRPGDENSRKAEAYRIRMNAARMAFQRGSALHPTNGDEERYSNRIGNFTKGLPHNALGEVDPNAYLALLNALSTGQKQDFEAIPLGLGAKLTNPQSGLAFDLEGPDSHSLTMPPAPELASAQGAGELVELYWMALARDVHFADWSASPVITAAAEELSSLSDFRGPKADGRVTPDTLFRGNTSGDLVGPYLSQFLWLPIPQGSMSLEQKLYTMQPDSNYLTGYDEWLAIQNGFKPAPYAMDSTPRYIRNLRDLGEWVHVDALYQAYHQACLILLGLYGTPGQRNWYGNAGAPFDAGNPYWASNNQACFGTFCGPHILSLVTEVASRALKACWFQKWFVSRRLRPEAMGGLLHQTRASIVSRPLHSDVLNASAPGHVYSLYGSYLLPTAVPEGSPTHPSYAAGHATVAGACVTILKAWFEESTVIPYPVMPNADGTALVAYNGPALTVGNELNKLAANVAQGRNTLGIHYRSDYWESLKLGEQLAIGILQEQAATYNEGGSWTLTRFDGTTITI